MFSGSSLTLSYTNFIVLRIYAEALDRLRVRLNMYLVCNKNITLCAECPENVSIIIPSGPPYTAGDLLTCITDGYPATYEWTVDGDVESTASTYALEEGVHEYECTVTVVGDEGSCSNEDSVSLTAFRE